MRRDRRPARNNALQNRPNTLRIIGGEWRGRRIRFPGLPGLRPTPDRVRETLFNWLAADVGGSRCLDLFAGSGALGLEALSRGAAHVTFLEQERAAAEKLRETANLLAPGRATVIRGDALAWLAASPSPYDIVFLDPPFDAGLLPTAMQAVAAGGWLAADACIYLEAAEPGGLPPLPSDWRLHRSGRAGAVGYHLARRQRGGGEDTT